MLYAVVELSAYRMDLAEGVFVRVAAALDAADLPAAYAEHGREAALAATALVSQAAYAVDDFDLMLTLH